MGRAQRRRERRLRLERSGGETGLRRMMQAGICRLQRAVRCGATQAGGLGSRLPCPGPLPTAVPLELAKTPEEQLQDFLLVPGEGRRRGKALRLALGDERLDVISDRRGVARNAGVVGRPRQVRRLAEQELILSVPLLLLRSLGLRHRSHWPFPPYRIHLIWAHSGMGEGHSAARPLSNVVLFLGILRPSFEDLAACRTMDGLLVPPLDVLGDVTRTSGAQRIALVIRDGIPLVERASPETGCAAVVTKLLSFFAATATGRRFPFPCPSLVCGELGGAGR